MARRAHPLPGRPGKALQAVWDRLEAKQREATLPHLLGGTSAEWVAQTLTEEGFPIGKTSIREYRRSLRDQGVQL